MLEAEQRWIVLDEYLLETCKECGNRGLLKQVAKHDQVIFDYVDDEPVLRYEYYWILLECPVCKAVSLYLKVGGDYMTDDQGQLIYDETIVYPVEKRFKNVPPHILKSYQAAVKTAKVDLEVSLIAIRAVLEKICKEKAAKGRNLREKLEYMVDHNIFPKTLDNCGYIIREMGNSGAHGDDNKLLRAKDIEELIGFIETIMYYIYELPVKIDDLNKRFDLELEKHLSNNKELD